MVVAGVEVVAESRRASRSVTHANAKRNAIVTTVLMGAQCRRQSDIVSFLPTTMMLLLSVLSQLVVSVAA